MGFTRNTDDMLIISKLSDQPNIDDEHDGAWLKAKFDEGGGLLKVFLNNTLIAELESADGAGNIGAAPITGLTAEPNIQAMLEAIYQIAKDAQAGIVSDGSIYPRHLNETFVLPASMVDPNYVAGADNIGSGAVTTPKLNDGAVTADKIAAEAVSKRFTASIGTTWASDGPPYKQEKSVSGIVAEDEDHPIAWTINSGATLDQLTFVASADKITVTTDEVFTGEISVTATQSNTPHNFTLAAADWAPTGKPMKQTISVPGLLASDAPVVDMIPSDTYATAEAQLEAYGNIYRMVAGADTLTVYATEPTEVAIPIQIKAVRK